MACGSQSLKLFTLWSFTSRSSRTVFQTPLLEQFPEVNTVKSHGRQRFSRRGGFTPPRGQLATIGHVFHCHDLGGGDLLLASGGWSSWMLLNIPHAQDSAP